MHGQNHIKFVLSVPVIDFAIKKQITRTTTTQCINLHRVLFPIASKTLLVQITLRVWTSGSTLQKYWRLFKHSCLYIYVSVHRKSIMYNKPTRCNSGSIVFINNCRYALHISDADWTLYSAQPTLDIYTGFTPTQPMTNTSGSCYIL